MFVPFRLGQVHSRRRWLSLLAFAVTVSASEAQPIHWVPNAGGYWDIGSNWSSNSANHPSTADLYINYAPYVLPGTFTTTLRQSAYIRSLLNGWDLIIDGGNLTTAAGVTTTRPITLVNSGLLRFVGTSTFVGEIRLNTNNAYSGVVGDGQPGSTLTLAGGSLVHGQGYLSNPNAGAIYNLLNQGTISADVPGETLYVWPVNGTNTGLIKAEGLGARLYESGSWTTAGFGTQRANNGGVLQFAGFLDNTGATLDAASINSGGGSFVLSGTLRNGQVTGSRSMKVQSGYLDGVTLDNGLMLDATANVQHNLSTGGSIDIVNSGQLKFNGTSAFAGEIRLNTNNAYSGIVGDGQSGSTVTLAGGSLVHGQGYLSNPNVGVVYNLLNQGTIIADVPGETLYLWPINGTNTGLIMADGTGARLYENGTWTTLGFGIQRASNGGILQFAGLLQNGGGILEAGPIVSGGGIFQVSGTIRGGLVTGSRSMKVQGGYLDSVTLDNGLLLDGNLGGSAYVQHDLTTGGSIDLVNSGQLKFLGNSVFSGTIGLNTSNSGGVAGDGQQDSTVTLASGALVHGQGYLSNPYYGVIYNLVNQGSILADVPGQTLQLSPINGFNTGLVKADGLGARLIETGAWTTAGFGIQRASNGGILQFAGLLNNTGAIFDAGAIDAGGGRFELSGTIRGGNIFDSRAIHMTGGTLDGVTLDDGLLIDSGVVVVSNGLTGGGPIDITGSGILKFQGTQTFNGIINEDASGYGGVGGDGQQGSTVTFGPSALVRGGGTVGNPYYSTNIYNLINQGIISADASGKTLTVGPSTMVNQGIIEAKNGGQLSLYTGNVSNLGLIRAEGSGSRVSESMTGTTAAFGTQRAVNGGVVSYSGGTLENTATVFDATSIVAGGGSFELNATIHGGEIAGSRLITYTGGTLDGVTLDNGLGIDGQSVKIRNGITPNGTIDIANSGSVNFLGTQTFLGTINLNRAGGYYGGMGGDGQSSALTLAPGSLVRGSGTVGRPYYGYYLHKLVNQGLISADVTGDRLDVNPLYYLVNSGIMEAKNGAELIISSSYGSNTGIIRGDGVGTRISEGGNWTTKEFGVQRVTNGATFTFYGNLKNRDRSFDVASIVSGGGKFTLNGTIEGGSVTNSRSMDISQGTLDGVTLDAGLLLDGDHGYIAYIQNGLVPGGPIDLRNSGTLIFRDSETFNGTINLDTTGYGGVSAGTPYTQASLTIGQNSIIRGRGNVGYNGNSTSKLANMGLISADIPNGILSLNPQSLTNMGTLEARNGGQLYVQAGPRSQNRGLIQAEGTNSRVYETGSWSSADFGVQRAFNGGTLNFAGTYNNTGTSFNAGAIDAGGGIFQLFGTIIGGTISGSRSIKMAGGTLDSVTLDNGLLIDGSTAYSGSFRNGVTTAGPIDVTNGTLTFNGPQDFSGPMNLTNGQIRGFGDDQRVTWIAGSVVRGWGYLSQLSSLQNNGSVVADVANQTLVLTPQGLTNTGSFEARNGGRLDIAPAILTNAGSITAYAGSSVTIRPTFGGNGGAIRAEGSGAVAQLYGTWQGTSIGALRSMNGGRIEFAGTLNNAGTLDLAPITAGGGTFQLSGGTLKNGTLRSSRLLQTSNGFLDGMAIDSGLNLSGNNNVTIRNGFTSGGSIDISGAGNLRLEGNRTFGGAVTLDGSRGVGGTGTVTLTPTATVKGRGLFGSDSSQMTSIINQGRISADIPGQSLNVSPAGLTNSGTMEVKNGANLSIYSTTFTNSGSVNISAFSEMTYNTFTQSDGVLQVDGTLNGNNTLNLNRGVLTGGGTIGRNVVLGGNLSPGHGIGTLTMFGALSELAGASTNFEIAGASASQADKLVANTGTLGGKLTVSLLNNYTPTQNTSWDLFRFGESYTGTFSSILMPTYNTGNWFLDYQPNSVYLLYGTKNRSRLALVPEPSTVITFLLALIGTAGSALRKKRRALRSVRLCASILAPVVLVAAASAQQAVTFDQPTGFFADSTWSLGWSFRMETTVNVTRLGFYDYPGNGLGLLEPHEVGIWDDQTGTLLMKGTVTSQDIPEGTGQNVFYFTDSITTYTPAGTTLIFGHSYSIGATTFIDGSTYNPPVNFATDGALTFQQSRQASSSTLVRPNLVGAFPSSYFGPNFQFSVPQGFRITSTFPHESAQASSATITAFGNGFRSGAQLKLARAGSADILPTGSTHFRSSYKLDAEFDLSSAAPGVYDVVVVNGDAQVARLDHGFTVIEGQGTSDVQFSLSMPSALLGGRQIVATLTYTNVGTGPALAPLVVASNLATAQPILSMRLSPTDPWTSDPLQILCIGDPSHADRLAPGESHSVPIYCEGAPAPSAATLSIDQVISVDPLAFANNWSVIQQQVRPPGIEDAAWNSLWSSFIARVGSDTTSYMQALRDSAVYLANHGEQVYDVRRLFVNALAQSTGDICPLQTLDSSVDVVESGPGLGIEFIRFAPTGIDRQYRLGPFGRGWAHSFEFSLREIDASHIEITGPGGRKRLFTYSNSAVGNRGWQSEPGDHGKLLQTQSLGYTLSETDGSVLTFDNLLRMVQVTERNGNSLNLAYNASRQLVSVTHSNGRGISLTYNLFGRIASATDSSGRTTNYGYDLSGDLLQAVTQTGNRTTAYQYNTGNAGGASYALLRSTYPDGTEQNLGYDSLGRLTSVSGKNQGNRVTFSYPGQGRVEIANANNDRSVLERGRRGQLLSVINPMGGRTVTSYDLEWNATQVQVPSGGRYSSAYDTRGNSMGVTDPSGATLRTGFSTNFDSLVWLVDQHGGGTYHYLDAKGNVNQVARQDGTINAYTYDINGLPLIWKNRRGQLITFTYNDRGQVATITRPDGHNFQYQYDTHGNMTLARDNVTGTITMQYDARDFMTRIDYPGGKWFTYQYDNSGRRTRREDQAGFVLNYSYDSLGRLSTIIDGNGNLGIQYLYDAVGRLARENKGNGTHTTYDYDGAGRVSSIKHYAPTNAIQSFFNYTYDTNGNPITVTTVAGTETYTYDPSDQLIGATMPGGYSFSASYDSAGNRVATTENGITKNYTPNGLNQYSTSTGVVYQYDADGNMTSKTEASGTTTYTYDAENKLIGVTAPGGNVWQYTYDALGNRTRVVKNGVPTNYVYDGTSLATELDGAGGLAARYVHGLGLLSRVDGNGTAFYSFDARGATCMLTNASGTVANTYTYAPFGAILFSNAIISNRLRFAGRYGTLDDGGYLGLRSRFYDPSLGRFLSEDPDDVGGGDLNLYRYCGNEPLVRIDVDGRFAIPAAIWLGFKIYQGIDLTAKGVLAGQQAFQEYAWRSRTGESGLELTGNVLQPIGKFLLDDFLLGWLIGKLPGEKLVGQFGKGALGAINKGWYSLDTNLRGPARGAAQWLKSRPDRGWGVLAGGLDKVAGAMGSLYGGIPKASGTTRWFPRGGDPNEKLGPLGVQVGSVRYLPDLNTFEYQILFENIPSAPAPAAEVFVTDFLDFGLDWSTFELGSVGFGDQTVSALAGAQSGAVRVPLHNSANVVDISAALNPSSGKVQWTFRTIDPFTNDLPDDPFGGFLPPDLNHDGRGQGQVSFRIKPLSRPDGTVIRNKARIVFDTNDPIDTNYWVNTLDLNAPSSSVAALPPSTEVAQVPITWSGSDGTGSGIQSYDILVSDNNGPYTPWLSSTTATSGTFTGVREHTYRFYSIARDHVGHVEVAPSQPDATIAVMAPVRTVSGKAEFEMNEGPAITQVEFEFRIPGQTTPYETRIVSLTADGSFSIQVDAGQFDMSVKHETWLRRTTFVNALQNVSGLIFAPKNGDCDEDNTIDIADFALMSQHYGETSSSPNWDPRADVTHDGFVDIADYSVMSANYGLSGDD